MNTAIKNLNVRTKRAKLMVEMGLIHREDNGFNIKSLHRSSEVFRVWRDDKGRVRCSCPDFEQYGQEDPRFRCEHILAVKYFLEPALESTTEVATETTTASGVELAIETSETSETTTTPKTPAPLTTSELPEIAVAEFKIVSQSPETPALDVTERIVSNMETETLSPALPAQPTKAANFLQLLKELSQPIPKELVRQRFGWTDKAGHDHEIDYIEWHTVADLLDRVYPEWSQAVKDIRLIGDIVAVTVSITIMGVTREGVGTGSSYDEKGIKKAEHDALKRAAVKFGIARELYKKDEEEPAATNVSLQFPRDPVAKNIAEMATTKQHAAIRAIANAQGLNAETECESMLNCKLADLSRRAASAFIDHLKNRTALSISA